MFAKLTNGTIDQYPYTVGDLRRDNPQTSFPRQIPDETLAEYGVVKVTPTPQPTYDNIVERPKELPPVEQDGEWVQQWTTEVYADADSRARAHRDRLLAASDWTQLPDASADSAAWATYRQALRDVPQQAGFPADIAWPTKP